MPLAFAKGGRLIPIKKIGGKDKKPSTLNVGWFFCYRNSTIKIG